ncbi:hypothetical protein [Anaerovibrio lipolyticus]|uniref:hypothetical protein n=1 Tax=Anaerovibrio lipolyticus TaxID=82374 RepID=UPI0025EE0467|nr:hypothetical protein [Anaerovibrio lipolyticus]
MLYLPKLFILVVFGLLLPVQVFALLKKGIITEKEAADEIGMTVDDFKKAMGAVS